MGFIDRLDDALTLGKASHSAQREAKKFARTVKPGRTYYTITTLNAPWGRQQVLEEHVFTGKLSLITALPQGAAALWLQCGPVYDNRQAGACRGLMTLREHSQSVNDCDSPNIGGSLHDYAAQPKRTRRAA